MAMDQASEDRSNSFGVQLRRAREAAGFAQEELAERAGLSPNTIGGLERGEHHRPYPATIRALADALGMTDAERAALIAAISAPAHHATATDTVPFGLPTPLVHLVGREREAEIVSALLRADLVRLVTLTGPGGVGKTALALQVAADLGPEFGYGAVFVSLAAVRDSILVASTIARALGLAETGDRSLLDRLCDTLRNRHLLLVLDNFEHLLDAAPLVSDLLSWCLRLAVLATSRAPLWLAGERIVPVPPLAVSDPDRLPATDELAGVAAVRLFVDRARAANPGFVLSDENAGAVAAICHRLDGLPLAIELAAARSTVFTPAAMLPRLAQRLPLLVGGRRDAPERQRTLRNAIAWSHDLLTGEQRELFRRLSVFVGGFTLDAAEAVGAGERGTRTDTSLAASCLSPSTFDGIAALVDHSLLRHEPGPAGLPRYRMLETIREFGLEFLEESGEAAATRDAHAAYFAALDGQLEPNRLDPGERFYDRLLRIEADHPNCREALAHMAANGDAVGMLRLAGALGAFWNRGHLREGRQWLEWALERTAGVDLPWRGNALASLSLILCSQGDTDRAAIAAERARAIAEATGDTELLALAVHMLGLVEVVRGHWDQAERLMTEALEVQRAIGTPGYGAWAIAALGTIAHRRGDAVTSARLSGEALTMFRAIGHDSGAATALCTLAGLASERGDERKALAAYQEALELWVSSGERSTISLAFSGLAVLAAALDQPELAATLIGVVDARLDESGADRLQGHRLYERAAAAAQAGLGEERFAVLASAGRDLPFAAAVKAGTAVIIPDAPKVSSGPAASDVSTLVARERAAPWLPVEGHSPAYVSKPDRQQA
jgi:predicted ATPase/DNA-binding XRE family transcriptional regulator